jgi:CheY-like chemotaxis protein
MQSLTTSSTSGAAGLVAGAAPLRVLIVDDERDTVTTLTAIMRHEGHEVQGAYDGNAALERVEAFDPDVVLVDIAMHGMTGWDVAREIRQRNRGRPVLIAITGTYIKTPDELLSRVAGFNHFFVKPCDPRRLTRILGAIAARK